MLFAVQWDISLVKLLLKPIYEPQGEKEHFIET